MRVRPYLPTDAEPLSRLYARSIQAHAASDYSHEQRAAWARLAPSAERLEALMADGRRRFVAVEGETVVGFLDLEANGHIHLLYKAPEAGRGVAALLGRVDAVFPRRVFQPARLAHAPLRRLPAARPRR